MIPAIVALLLALGCQGANTTYEGRPISIWQCPPAIEVQQAPAPNAQPPAAPERPAQPEKPRRGGTHG